MSSHEVAPFDALVGAPVPFEGFGDIVRGHDVEERLQVVAAEASRRIGEVFGLDIGMDRNGVASLDGMIQGMWQTGWDPKSGDVNLFLRDFGSLLMLALKRGLGGELIFRSMTDLSHASLWWPAGAVEVFPFHKVLKALSEREGESLLYFYDALKGKVTKP